MVDVGHRCVENMYTSWRTTVKGFVQTKQEAIHFGSKSSKMDELEVDEAVVRKTELGDNKVQWHEVVGLKRRGDRESLLITKRPAAGSSAAASLRDCVQRPLQDHNIIVWPSASAGTQVAAVCTFAKLVWEMVSRGSCRTIIAMCAIP
jgi:hypothetical protein